MALTIEEKKNKIKEKRSRSIKTILDILKTRDGSDAPPIESSKDVDEFNRQMLFGLSGNQNINWQQMGVEGLIRCYYKIIELFNGTKRNNLITDLHDGSLTTRSSLDKAGDWVIVGRAYISGFFKGWISGQDGRSGDSSDDLKNQALRGELDLASSSFTHNRDRNSSGSYPSAGPSATSEVPAIMSTIGSGGWGVSGTHPQFLTFSEILDMAPDNILARRLADIFPEIEKNTQKTRTVEVPDPDDPTGEDTIEIEEEYYDMERFYGNSRSDTQEFADKVFRTRYSFSTSASNPDNLRVLKNGSELHTHNIERIINRIYNAYNSSSQFTAELNADDNEILVSTISNGATIDASSNSPNITVTTDRTGSNSGLFKYPQRTKIKVNGLINPGEYISIYSASNTRYYGWFTIDGNGTQPSPGGVGIQINISQQYLIQSDKEIYIPSFSPGQNVEITVGEISSNSEYQIYKWFMPGFDSNAFYDYYDSSIESRLNTIKLSLQEAIQYIEYSKVDDLTYFTNPDIIPFYPDYNEQNVWINDINEYISVIGTFLDGVDGLSRLNKNDALLQLITDLNGLSSLLNQILSDIDPFIYLNESDSGSGHTPNDLDSLYGIRQLLVKSIINTQDGSKIQIKSVENTVKMMNESITDAEKEFAIYGITRSSVPWSSSSAWIGGLPNSEIVGIIQYIIPDLSGDPLTNENYGEMIVAGQVISWQEVAHATGYNLYKSTDWDGTSGTWNLILPAGNTFSIQDMDPNTGKIISYYIDETVTEDETPYYKVVAYDHGQVGVTDYQRIPAQSEESEPKNIEDFEGAASSSPHIGPTTPAPGPDEGIPEYLFKWSTIKQGSESNDVGRTIFESETAFDGVGSNLEVFVNGELLSNEEYTLINSKEIQLNNSINSSDTVVMIVYFGKGSGSGSGAWKDPVNSFSLLPTVGNSDGDIRLVLNEAKLYVWVQAENGWETVRIDVDDINITHSDLLDMPEDGAYNSDHDDRYYTETEVDQLLGQVNGQLQSLQYLIPKNANPVSGELIITGTTTYTGKISAGNNLSILEPHQQINTIITGGTFTLKSNDEEKVFGHADKGELRLIINNITVDTFSLESNFDEDERNTIQTYPPLSSLTGKIEIIEVKPWNNYGVYQKGVFRIHLSESDLISGENSIKVEHLAEGEIYDTDPFIVFYDDNTELISFANISVTQHELITNKYLSGLRHYSKNDKFKINFQALNLFKNTYKMPNQILVGVDNFGVDDYYTNYQSPDVSNTVNGNIDDTVQYEKIIKIDKDDHYSVYPFLKLKGYSPHEESAEFLSNPQNILINTHNVTSDDKNEYFVDEYYRLPSTNTYDSIPKDYTGVWNSQNLLQDGELQIYDQRLLYPSLNFTQYYYPAQTANYSGYSGTRSYVRVFRDFGLPHNNGTFFIKDIHLNDDTTKIYMKLPSQTGWLDLKTWYNEADFNGENDDGCLTANDGFYFTWTSGEYSTAYSGYMVIIKVVMSNPAYSPISQISIDW